MRCLQCGMEFDAQRVSAKYCSAVCRVRHSRTVTETPLNVTDNVTVSPLSVTPVPNSVTKSDSVTDSVTPCLGCFERDLSMKKLQARVAFLEKSMERYAALDKSQKSSYRLGPEFRECR